MKPCNKCDVQLIANISITTYRLNHRDYICNSCKKERDRELYLSQKTHRLQKAKERYLLKKEEIKKNVLKYHLKNRDKILNKWKEKRITSKNIIFCKVCNNSIAIKERSDKKYCSISCKNKSYNLRNRDKYLKRVRMSRKRRYHENPLQCLKERCRSRLSSFLKLKGKTRSKTTIEILGCEWETLKLHLETQFIDGMTWDNKNLWHIDHIIPLASATTEKEMINLCHYSNLQPLWAIDNLMKGSKTL